MTTSLIAAMSAGAGTALTIFIIIVICLLGGFIITDDFNWFD